MTNQELNRFINDLHDIANTMHAVQDVGVGVSLSQENFEYWWFIKNSPDSGVDYVVKTKTVEDAFKIVQAFSGEPYESVSKKLTHVSKFDANKELYLHFSKRIKHI